MSNHTPGPLHTKASASGDVAILTAGDSIVAECFADIRNADECSRDEALANSRLFAAAPDLLNALHMVGTLRQLGGMLPGTRELIQMVIDDADAAIAKATGDAA